MFKTVKNINLIENKIEVKKSIFISHIAYVESEAEANEKIEEIKNKYKDATHNVYAYLVLDSGEKYRCSDDGEPAKTAGSPILSIIQNQDLKNLVIIVTRYFGGTELGTGGLVKAYTDAAVEGLNKLDIVYKSEGIEIEFNISYEEFDILKRNIDMFNKESMIECIKILDTKYLEQITLKVFLSYDKFQDTKDFEDKIVKNLIIQDLKVLKESIN